MYVGYVKGAGDGHTGSTESVYSLWHNHLKLYTQGTLQQGDGEEDSQSCCHLCVSEEEETLEMLMFREVK